jgi:hypothetical protein
MGNTSGQAYALTVMTPVLPERTAELRAYIGALPSGEESPLARMRTTHFARWLVLDDLVYQGPPQKPDHLGTAYLIFITSFDGALDRYLADMAALMGPEADAVWGSCVGYPGRADAAAFADYLRHNQIDTAFFFSAYPQASVPEVRACLTLRQDLADFAVAAQQMRPAELAEEFAARFLESV